jgi:hypothetical protein
MGTYKDKVHWKRHQYKTSRTSDPRPPLVPPPPPFLRELLESTTAENTNTRTLEQPTARPSRDSYTGRPPLFLIISSSTSAAITNITITTNVDYAQKSLLLTSFMMDLFEEKGVFNPKEDVTLVDDKFQKLPYIPSAKSTMGSAQIIDNTKTQAPTAGDKKNRSRPPLLLSDETLVDQKYEYDLLYTDAVDFEYNQNHNNGGTESSWQDSCRSIEPLMKDSDIFSSNSNGKSPTSIMDVFGLGEIPESLSSG